MVDEFDRQIKQKIKIKFQDRRQGDMEMLIANNKKLKNFIKWKPKYNNLSDIIKSCIKWEKRINS